MKGNRIRSFVAQPARLRIENHRLEACATNHAILLYAIALIALSV